MFLCTFISANNPVDQEEQELMMTRVIIIPLCGPSDQIRSDPQIQLRCQIRLSVVMFVITVYHQMSCNLFVVFLTRDEKVFLVNKRLYRVEQVFEELYRGVQGLYL